MNKRFIYSSLIVVCVFAFHFSKAKSIVGRKDSGVYISLNGIYSLPVGYFKSPNYAGAGSCAMNGYGSSIEIEYPQFSSVGLAFEGGYCVNPFNLSAYENIFIPFYKNNSFYYYNFNNAAPYRQIPVLIGLFVEKKVKKFCFQIQGLAGVDFVTLAHVNDSVDLYNPNSVHLIEFRSFKGSFPLIPLSLSTVCLVYNLKFSARYTLSRYISIQANAGYFNNFMATSKPSGMQFNNEFLSQDSWIPLSQVILEIGMTVRL